MWLTIGHINNSPISYQGVFSVPLKVDFPILSRNDKHKTIPNIALFQARLFLNENAFQVLHPLLKDDGEFIPAISEQGSGYLFNPLRVAESVQALDLTLSKKNTWGHLENMAFHEEKLEGWNVFRSEFNAFMSLQCSDEFKQVIEVADLTGVYFTEELGNAAADKTIGSRSLN
ncbi:imm11 family protein [Marinibactrum halimedae]|uniref:Uncharacterized protein n=1 Tax=Marinibactrum halimedae TaxID=1444977 RepID=A0AA37T5V8_9GAMM|nr:DUF1629 domain-containing protein [Marinibactrum halimedae]MCD9460578.1 hypothetical protein [Marinibactrum halimedae]GLS27209.1 hypothetical protein GCM10007877_29280 [Marinibactrum halimedae]